MKPKIHEIISLGSNCEVAVNLKRLNLRHGPTHCFDYSLTGYSSLLSMLNSKFEDVFKTTENVVRIQCYKTNFFFGHQPMSDIAPVIERWKRRVDRFLSLSEKNQNYLFIRQQYPNEPEDKTHGEEIREALRKCGFRNFHLLYLSSLKTKGDNYHLPIKTLDLEDAEKIQAWNQFKVHLNERFNLEELLKERDKPFVVEVSQNEKEEMPNRHFISEIVRRAFCVFKKLRTPKKRGATVILDQIVNDRARPNP